MKQSLNLSLAITLALSGANAYALGLGSIQIKSGLNQPLNAEIPVLVSAPGEAEGLTIQLATDEDFARVGLDRARINTPLEFSIGKDSHDGTVIRITTREAVREPYLDFLIQANWSKGRLLREYTVLLDPPVMAPATKGAPALVTATKEPEPAVMQPLASDVKTTSTPSATVGKTATTAKKPAVSAQPRINGNEYGPVAAGETLSTIARNAIGNDKVSVNQMMLALLKNNPNAFYKNNINALKRGAILRIPSADEARAIGSMQESAAQVRAQVDEWRGVSSKPTLVSDTALAAAPATTEKPAKSKPAAVNEHLELVPPRANDESQASAARPGSGSDAGKGNNTEIKAELARTKEALTSREQESTELKSRLKELEELKGKNDHLITLKDSEIAELQRKLKELQEQKNQAAAAPPKVEAPTPTTPPAAVATPPVPAETAPAQPAAVSNDNGTTPPPSTPSATNEEVKKPAPAPVVPPATTNKNDAPKAQPAPPQAKETVWYLRPLTLGAGAVVALLLLVAGLSARKRSASSSGRRSISDAFDESVFQEDIQAEEQALLDQLQETPEDASLHLELLSLYYANQDSEKFEAAAEEMYARIADPNQPEWQQVKIMGEELAPNNPLFGGAQDFSHYADETAPENDAHSEQADFITEAQNDFVTAEENTANAEESFAKSDFDFEFEDPNGLQQVSVATAAATEAPSSKEEFSFDLPSFEFTPQTATSDDVMHEASAPVHAAVEDEFFVDEEAIATKLDLAKAYFDMGDTEGSRAMLEEVLAEGNEAQQNEARKLLADIK